MLKTCSVCNKTKNLICFPRNKRCKDGHTGRCKDCVSKHKKEWYSATGRTTQRDANLKRAYGIGLEEWNVLFAKQDGKCAICGEHQSSLKTSLNVDHCHKTGKIRGLLCPACNRGIGFLRDSQDMLRKAMDYLDEYSQGP